MSRKRQSPIAARFVRLQKREMDKQAKIDRVVAFRDALQVFRTQRDDTIRTFLNENLRSVRREVMEAGCMKTFTIAPPPAVGGMVIQNADPFSMLYDAPWGRSMVPSILDMLDETIGVLRDPSYGVEEVTAEAFVSENPTQKGFVFIAMPMAGGKPEYDDVHDAIVHAAVNCGLHAERVDDVQSNDRITDRLLESIRRAEFVIADLTDSKPNVFYEAGYAYGQGKTPIYVARVGTRIEFDLKDYPIIFFESLRQLREGLEKRLRGISSS